MLEQVTEAVPFFARAHTKLCLNYNYLYDDSKDSNYLRLAGDSCERAKEIDPDDPELNLALGLHYSNVGDSESARDALNRVFETENDFHLRALLGFGRIYRLEGNVFEAEASYREALETEPNSSIALLSIGTFYFTQGMYVKAVQTYEKYVDLEPDSERVFNNLGASYLLLGRFEDAFKIWEKTDSSEANSNVGYALYLLGRYVEAAESVQLSLNDVSSDHRLWGNLGEILRFVPGKEDEAFSALEQAITLAEDLRKQIPDDGETLSRLAVYYSSLNRRSQAEEMIQLSVENANIDVYVLFDVAVALNNLGEQDAARRQLKQAVEMGYPRALAESDPLFKEVWRADLRD